MARVIMDQGAVERLIGELISSVSHASISDRLLPGEEPPDAPAGIVVQYLGCDFDYDERMNEECAHLASVTFEVVLLCPAASTVARAYAIQTAASAVMAALSSETKTDSNGHKVDVITQTPTRVEMDTPGFRAILISCIAKASRNAGATFET